MSKNKLSLDEALAEARAARGIVNPLTEKRFQEIVRDLGLIDSTEKNHCRIFQQVYK